MRLILPGTLGVSNTYYIRVSSNGGNDRASINCKSACKKQPEVPGSTVQFADIRDATTAIDVQGSARQLAADQHVGPGVTTPRRPRQGFISNTTFDSAQDLGNLLTSDQNMVSVSSQLLNAAQVQWYKFTLTYADIQSIDRRHRRRQELGHDLRRRLCRRRFPPRSDVVGLRLAWAT